MSGMAEKMKLRVQGSSISSEFRSGLWAKDVIRDHGATGAPVGSRFLNAHDVSADGELHGVKLYEFDSDFRLVDIVIATSARYLGRQTWRLSDMTETRFGPMPGADTRADATVKPISIQKMASADLSSEITPEILSVLFADPNRMSAKDLATYTRHLAENKQHTERYEIAFWKKIVYPFAVIVMMALALPFAYMHVRAGGVSLKIFIGIMIGVSFQLLNSLFSHLGLLKGWPPFATAVLPSLAFLLMAVSALIMVERR
jgi:lipopolysaccharide export system permease protein